MPAFEYRQAEEVRDVFARHGVRYLFIGKSAAILLGFPDTTQDADLFVEKSPANGAALWCSLPTDWNTLRTRGTGAWKWKASPFATLTTSSPARPPPIGSRTANRCRACAHSATTGWPNTAVDYSNRGHMNIPHETFASFFQGPVFRRPDEHGVGDSVNRQTGGLPHT